MIRALSGFAKRSRRYSHVAVTSRRHLDSGDDYTFQLGFSSSRILEFCLYQQYWPVQGGVPPAALSTTPTIDV